MKIYMVEYTDYDGGDCIGYFTDDKKSAQLNRALDARGLNDKNKDEVKSLLYEANFGSDGPSYTDYINKQKAQQQSQQQAQPKTDKQSQKIDRAKHDDETIKIAPEQKTTKAKKRNSQMGMTGLENPTQNNNSTGNS